MATQPTTYLSPEEYLKLEREAEFRSEYINGEMFAMAGGTRNHARIAINASSMLRDQLRGTACEAAAGELRVFSAAFQIYTYPDLVVTCGREKYQDDRRDTITDARLTIEILSPSTMNYDRGEKFRFYRSLPSFAEYLLIAQDTIRAEHHVRQPDASWVFREFTSAADVIELQSIGCKLQLESLYERVEFEAGR